MITLIYGLIIFCACTIGALVGIGGGAIIKTLLDFIGYHTVDIVGFVATCTVFSMSVSSSIRHIIAKTKVNKKIVLLVSFGSIFGGIAGNKLFNAVFNIFNSNIVKGVQAVILASFLIFVIIYVNTKNAKSLHIKNPIATVLTGLMLGLMSSFLGIGGGPINTAFLVLLFSFTVKESAVYSVAIIFFSQLSQLVTIFLNNRFEPYKQYLPMIVVLMAVAVIGGLIGAKLNKKCSNKIITKVFSIVLSFVAIINVFNAITGFTA